MFKLSNLVLYAKGWYLNTEDIYSDLIKILELDGFTVFSNTDIYYTLLSAVQESNIYRWTELKEVLNGIHPSNCWKSNYKYTEYNIETAFIYYTISNLRFLDNTQWIVKKPEIDKYSMGKNISIEKIKSMF